MRKIGIHIEKGSSGKTMIVSALLLFAISANVTSAPRIAYKIAWEHAIPNGGYTRYIIISPANRNEADIRALGEELKIDTGMTGTPSS